MKSGKLPIAEILEKLPEKELQEEKEELENKYTLKKLKRICLKPN